MQHIFKFLYNIMEVLPASAKNKPAEQAKNIVPSAGVAVGQN